MPLQLACACGNQLRVPEVHAGKRVQCPRCGASHLVGERTVAPAARPHHHPAGKPSRFPLLLLLALVPVLFGLAAAGWWFLGKNTRPETDDLSLIPGDALAFASVRLREVWESSLGKQVLADLQRRDPNSFDLAARLDRGTGLRPEEVERLSVVSVDLERRIGWIVARTASPYDRDKVLSRLQQPRHSLYLGKSYVAGIDPEGREVAVHFVTPTILVASTEEGVKTCLAYLRSSSRGVRGRLSPVIDLCDARHHVVAGLSPGPDGQRLAQDNEVIAPLVEKLRRGQLTLDYGDGITLVAKVQVANEEEAKKFHGAIKGYISAAQWYLFGLSFKQDEKGKAAEKLRELLGQLEVEQRGENVTASITTDATGVIEALMMLPNMPGR